MASAILCAGILGLAGTATAAAQEPVPGATPDTEREVDLVNVDGDMVGAATFTEVEGTVVITTTVTDLPPGEHGFHIHETGVCDPAGDDPFSSAGGHFNPTGTSHGPGPASGATPAAATPGNTESHAGDLGNITVEEDGTATLAITSDRLSLGEGDNALADEDGSALMIHENADDLMTDPSGESGPRIACGVIFAPTGGTPAS